MNNVLFQELMMYIWHPSRFNRWKHLDDTYSNL
jgi:hypothetical protein